MNDNTQLVIRSKRDYFNRRIQELYAEIDEIDEGLRLLRDECTHPNRKYYGCPDCDEEFFESETEGS